MVIRHGKIKTIMTTPLKGSPETSGKALLICNAYPSTSNLYRNGFIHRRIKGYQEEGLEVDVFYNHEPVTKAYDYEFDGVKVKVGNHQALEHLVRESYYSSYLVHFAEPTRIEPLRRCGIQEPVIVWVHGFEAEAWYRRWFNFIGSAEDIRTALRKKKNYYEEQNTFLAELMEDDALDVSFVNVSDWFQQNVVEPDVRAEFKNSVTIPNLVDEEVFPYREKDPALRKKILSIRPFASMKYANDQSVAAILELSKRPFFQDLEFTICGQGQLFDETVAPLRNFKNVVLKNEFFTQEEIAQLHAEHGVFLCPTRFDSQGVSMCEAISSGLVALSSNVAAIPEFIHHRNTGLLAPAEQPEALADLAELLYFDEELFSKLSQAGSKWVTENCGRNATIRREIELIRERMEN